mgnify:CR=1 FL=1
MKRMLLALCLMPALASADIFKCTSTDGRVDYRDKPCASSSDQVESIPPPPLTGLDKLKINREEMDRKYEQRKEQEKLDYKMRRMRQGLRLGMRESEVMKLDHFGFPDDLNATETVYGTNEQWVYEVDPMNEHERMYLYFEDGVLVTIQN